MSVFVDTSAFYALLVQTDADHEAVATEFRGLVERGRRLATSNYVVVETTAILQNRLGLAPVRDLEEYILPLLNLLWVDRPVHRAAVERLLRTDRRELSLVDCTSFELMDAGGIRQAFALDEDFEKEGYLLLPRR